MSIDEAAAKNDRVHPESPSVASVLSKKIADGAQLSAYAHFGASERMGRLHLWFGVPAAILSVILGSVVVADLQSVDRFANVTKWGVSVGALVVATLTTLQTFFNATEGKSKHRQLANSYLSVQRDATFLLARYDDNLIDVQTLAQEAADLNKRYGDINEAAQDFPTNDSDYARAKRKSGRK